MRFYIFLETKTFYSWGNTAHGAESPDVRLKVIMVTNCQDMPQTINCQSAVILTNWQDHWLIGLLGSKIDLKVYSSKYLTQVYAFMACFQGGYLQYNTQEYYP